MNTVFPRLSASELAAAKIILFFPQHSSPPVRGVPCSSATLRSTPHLVHPGHRTSLSCRPPLCRYVPFRASPSIPLRSPAPAASPTPVKLFLGWYNLSNNAKFQSFISRQEPILLILYHLIELSVRNTGLFFDDAEKHVVDT